MDIHHPQYLDKEIIREHIIGNGLAAVVMVAPTVEVADKDVAKAIVLIVKNSPRTTTVIVTRVVLDPMTLTESVKALAMPTVSSLNPTPAMN
jgi:hypothetical protein